MRINILFSNWFLSAAVSKAFTCLSDPGKRRHYDLTGAEPGENGHGGGGGGMHPFGGMARGRGGFGPIFEDEIDAEELFRMFFGGNPFMNPAAQNMFGQAARRQQQPRQQQQQQQQQQQAAGSPDGAALLRLLTSLAPLLIIILLQLFSSPSRPAFSLQQTRHYPAPLATATHHVPFFVSSATEFASKYPPGSRERTRVELSAENEWRQAMQQA